MKDTRPLLLYITDTEGLGGAEGYLRTLLLHADQQHYRVGLMLPQRQATKPLVDLARAHGIKVIFFDAVHHDGLNLAVVVRAMAVLRWLRPSIVHFVLAAPRRCAEIVVAAWLTRVPQRLITFQLVMPIPQFGLMTGWIRRLNRQIQFRTVTQGVAVSEGNRQVLIEQYGFPPKRLLLIPNSVDVQQFQPHSPAHDLRTRWHVPLDAPLIGMVGRLSYQKGHTVLFEALPQVWEAFPQAHVALVGDGELRSELQTQAAQIDTNGRIHFVGQQQDMPRVLSTFNLFVLSSRYEGLSFAVLEAMATQQAIVATAVDGTSEVIEDGHTGLLVPPNDAKALANAMVQLLNDPALRHRMGKAAREVVITGFNQQQMLAHTFALYRQQ
ncbi:MAG: glycosyltransferase [Chloroflexota bacterium]